MPTNTGNDQSLKKGGEYDPYLTTAGSGPGTFGVADADDGKLYSKKPRKSLIRDLVFGLLFVAICMAVIFVGVHIANADSDDDDSGGDGPPDDGPDDGGGGEGGGGGSGGGDLPEGPATLTGATQSQNGSPTDDEGDLSYDTWSAFNEYAETFGKEYANEAEREERMQNFQANNEQADGLNDMRVKDKDALFGWTKFSDRAESELDPLFGFKTLEEGQSIAGDIEDTFSGSLDDLESIDWRDYNRVTPVKNQGYCGSCWAFSAVETVESAMLMESDNPAVDSQSTNYILSEQQVVSCDNYDWGCGGGWPQYAFEYIEDAGGLETGETYPYVSGITMISEQCTDEEMYVPNSVPVSWIYATTPCWSGSCENQDEVQLAHALYNYGPIGVCLNARVWSWYTGGVVTPEQCGRSDAWSLDHCVQLVGMNLEEEYWIIRNSWGDDWAVGGYIYLSMGSNTCGIANMAFYVTLEE